MVASLSENQFAAYKRDGFLMPLDLLTPAEAAEGRAELEAIEAGGMSSDLPMPLARYLRVNTNIVMPMVARIAAHPAILDAVESLLGPDLLVWAAEFFIKEPGSGKIVSWHQDLTYWGLGETEEEVTAWVALSDVNEASGAMRFIPGSHRRAIVPHTDTFAEDNMLSRGQEIAVEVNEAEAVLDELRPGQVSLHHGRLFHASGPNVSDDRRIALAIRYLTPNVRQQAAARDYAVLVRGADRSGAWVNIAPPRETFGPDALRLHAEVLAAREAALAQGATGNVGHYAARTPA